MSDNASCKRALEILADPHSKENEWMGALAILDHKVPLHGKTDLTAIRKRFLKRVATFTILYTVVLYSTVAVESVMYNCDWGGLFCLQSPVPGVAVLFGLSLLETCTGFFTVTTVIAFFGLLCSGQLLTLDPGPHAVWLILLAIIFVYVKGRWLPYVFTGIRKSISLLTKQRTMSQIASGFSSADG